MAKRGREGALKRQRERARQEKQAIKREKRQARSDDGDGGTDVDEKGLMEEFARLSEDLENDDVTQEEYDRERQRIFVELGIESDEA